jgi:hypothetical protein
MQLAAQAQMVSELIFEIEQLKDENLNKATLVVKYQQQVSALLTSTESVSRNDPNILICAESSLTDPILTTDEDAGETY